ncbi:MAG: glycosyltransferase [Acidobacteriota bacterium]|nr:glycosyltransferase [Acidobacteriota bacterium]
MRILWAKTDFLHPTDRGGQIRTLETLRQLNANHEVHYVAYGDPEQPEGLRRAPEYCSHAYSVNRPIPSRGSPKFLGQLVRNLVSPLPLAVGRYASSQMRLQIQTLLSKFRFDSIVCDFLAIAPNIPDLSRCVLFQHNVETVIWRRHAEHAASRVRRAYFRMQADRMYACERRVCRSASHIIAVSESDAAQMKKLFGVDRISPVSTGVDLEFFARPPGHPRTGDLVFVGAMDWLPNIDGARWFANQVLPLIRKKRPRTSVVFAGRCPVAELRALALVDPLITVTGTVPDIRPYLWTAKTSIVPLRIGGGTRLKIYEAMASGAPVVSTAIGSEGLAVADGHNIALANDAEAFANRCLELLDNPERASRMAAAALALVTERFSWAQVGRHFESILQATRAA